MDLGIFVDASTSQGISIIFQGSWDAWRLAESWQGPCRDIGWLEGIALEFIIYTLDTKNFQDLRVIIHSDNKGVIGAFDKGRCRNFEINLSIRRTSSILAARNIILDLLYVESEANLADPISRGILGSPELRLTSSFRMPSELHSFFSHV